VTSISAAGTTGTESSTLLVVAGGGGGTRGSDQDAHGLDASLTEDGLNGTGGNNGTGGKDGGDGGDGVDSSYGRSVLTAAEPGPSLPGNWPKF
jgi:hypothetical protein